MWSGLSALKIPAGQFPPTDPFANSLVRAAKVRGRNINSRRRDDPSHLALHARHMRGPSRGPEAMMTICLSNRVNVLTEQQNIAASLVYCKQQSYACADERVSISVN